MLRISVLEPQYDSRKSFYDKAHILEYDGYTILQSYATNVAMIKDGKFYLKGMYSNTTARHIRDFAYQNGFPTDRKFLDECISETYKEGVSF